MKHVEKSTFKKCNICQDKEGEKKKAKAIKREEPSSLFQRRRVDMLLDQLTRQFPHKVSIE